MDVAQIALAVASWINATGILLGRDDWFWSPVRGGTHQYVPYAEVGNLGSLLADDPEFAASFPAAAIGVHNSPSRSSAWGRLIIDLDLVSPLPDSAYHSFQADVLLDPDTNLWSTYISQVISTPAGTTAVLIRRHPYP